MRGIMRLVGISVVVVFLLLTGVWGIVESVDDYPQADTLSRMVYTFLLAACGCFGLGAGIAVLARKPWAKILILGWAAALLSAVLISPLAWGWPGIGPTLAVIVFYLVLTSLTYFGWKATARSQER